jgi:hypothetical protein
VKGHMHGVKAKAPFGHTDGTHGKIEKEMRKHRASGGGVESAKKGDDQAEEDLKKENMEYTKDSNVNRESKEKKAAKGGKIARKSGGPVSGRSAFKHGGRMPRASGGGCESNPFTSARKGTMPSEHKSDSMDNN